MMNAEEIHFIVSNLFVGNKLEKGELELHEGEPLSLKNIQSPIVVFASQGDNITPPQQALSWIPKVYRSTDEIRKLGQVIVYIIHEDIGHLGIFVAASVAKKEHKEIIRSSEMIEFLPPGLYEMVIEGDVSSGNFTTHFEERTLDDIKALGDAPETEEDFSVVAQVSEFNDRLYRNFASPWVKAFSSEFSAEMIRWLNPLRSQRYMISDMNPMLRHLDKAASQVRANRKPVSAGNKFSGRERKPCQRLSRTGSISTATRGTAIRKGFSARCTATRPSSSLPGSRHHAGTAQGKGVGGFLGGLRKVAPAAVARGHGERRRCRRARPGHDRDGQDRPRHRPQTLTPSPRKLRRPIKSCKESGPPTSAAW